MKRLALGLALGVPPLLSLHGCAGLSTTATSTSYDVDAAQVAAVERVAQQSGVRVFWVSLPRKKAAVTGS